MSNTSAEKTGKQKNQLFYDCFEPIVINGEEVLRCIQKKDEKDDKLCHVTVISKTHNVKRHLSTKHKQLFIALSKKITI